MADMLRFVERPQAYPGKREAEARADDFREIAERYAVQSAEDQSGRCSQCGVPYCSVHCPLHNHIPDWLRLTAEGRLREAYELSNATSTMPEICGRICPQDRLCEGNCVIEFTGHGAVTIGSVEKFITDKAWEEGWVEPLVPGSPRGQSVGVIGAGPAGLSAAEYLRGHGYEVHVYDRHDRAGGLMIYGIPGFKLEKHVVMRRVERLEGKAAAMQEASETTLSLAVEHSLPPAVLAHGLVRLADTHPEVAVDLSYLTGGDVIARLTGGEVQLGITALERGLAWQDLDGRQVLAEEMPVVVGARHALAARNAPVPLEALEHHRQIYLPSGLPPTDENTRPDYRQHRTDLWHVNDLATQIALIAGGAGWGFVPASAAAEAVAQGRLAYLACDGIAQLPLRRFAALWRTRTPPGPAARFLMQVLEAGGDGTLEAP